MKLARGKSAYVERIFQTVKKTCQILMQFLLKIEKRRETNIADMNTELEGVDI